MPPHLSSVVVLFIFICVDVGVGRCVHMSEVLSEAERPWILWNWSWNQLRVLGTNCEPLQEQALLITEPAPSVYFWKSVLG